MIDTERFLQDYCEIYLGRRADSVQVTHFPTPLNPALRADPLTGRPPLETMITVEVRGETITRQGADLRETLTETMAAIEALRYPPQPDRPAVAHTYCGEEVSESVFIATYPAQLQNRATTALLGLYNHMADGNLDDYDLQLYLSNDPHVPPLLYTCSRYDGQEQFHLLPTQPR
ncbi:hypothetical protein [Mycobacteroides abscessus]